MDTLNKINSVLSFLFYLVWIPIGILLLAVLISFLSTGPETMMKNMMGSDGPGEMGDFDMMQRPMDMNDPMDPGNRDPMMFDDNSAQ